MNEIVFREMTLSDIEQVYQIECRCFTQPWSVDSLIGELVRNDVAYYVVAELDGRIVGYAGCWIMYDEAHMTNIAVCEDIRRRGVASRIIIEMMREARRRGAGRMTLEVREHNSGAQTLYASLGFTKIGIRRKYYSDTGENAFILWNNAIEETIQKYETNNNNNTEETENETGI